jgi:hypothetical protein
MDFCFRDFAANSSVAVAVKVMVKGKGIALQAWRGRFFRRLRFPDFNTSGA